MGEGGAGPPQLEYDSWVYGQDEAGAWEWEVGDRVSHLSLLLYLNDDFCGGETALLPTEGSGSDTHVVCVTPVVGDALCFGQSFALGRPDVRVSELALLHEGRPLLPGGREGAAAGFTSEIGRAQDTIREGGKGGAKRKRNAARGKKKKKGSRGGRGAGGVGEGKGAWQTLAAASSAASSSSSSSPALHASSFSQRAGTDGGRDTRNGQGQGRWVGSSASKYVLRTDVLYWMPPPVDT